MPTNQSRSYTWPWRPSRLNAPNVERSPLKDCHGITANTRVRSPISARSESLAHTAPAPTLSQARLPRPHPLLVVGYVTPAAGFEPGSVMDEMYLLALQRRGPTSGIIFAARCDVVIPAATCYLEQDVRL